jgi:hypothetical protein
MAGHPNLPNPTLPKKSQSKTNYQYGLIENALGELSIEDIELSNSKKNVYYGNSVKLREEHIISTVEDTCYIFSSELGGSVKKKSPTPTMADQASLLRNNKKCLGKRRFSYMSINKGDPRDCGQKIGRRGPKLAAN